MLQWNHLIAQKPMKQPWTVWVKLASAHTQHNTTKFRPYVTSLWTVLKPKNEFEEVHSTASILRENWLICCNELFMTYSVCCPIWHFCFYILFPTGLWWGDWPLIKAAWALKPPEIDSKQSEYGGIDQASQFIISFTPWMPKWWNIHLLLMLIFWSNLFVFFVFF